MKYIKYKFFLLLALFPMIASASLAEDSGLIDAGSDVNLIKRDIPTTVGIIVNFLLGLLGTLFTVLIIWGGFKWMTSRGNSEQVTDAKNIIKNSVIGLVIVLASYAIVRTVLEALEGTVGPDPGPPGSGTP